MTDIPVKDSSVDFAFHLFAPFYEKEIYRDEVTPEYERDIQTYVVPSTVKKIGEMCFNYANLRAIYLPEGLQTIETLAVFKLHERVDQWGTTPSLHSIFTYKASDVADSHFTSQDALGEVYLSLPEGLKFWLILYSELKWYLLLTQNGTQDPP